MDHIIPDRTDRWPDNNWLLRYFSTEEIWRSGSLEWSFARPSTLTNEIHPLFVHSSWKDLSKADYDLIVPALRLSSRFITESRILHFWHAILFGPCWPVRDPYDKGRPPQGFTFARYRNPYTNKLGLTISMMEQTVHALCKLTSATTLEFRTGPQGTVAP